MNPVQRAAQPAAQDTVANRLRSSRAIREDPPDGSEGGGPGAIEGDGPDSEPDVDSEHDSHGHDHGPLENPSGDAHDLGLEQYDSGMRTAIEQLQRASRDADGALARSKQADLQAAEIQHHDFVAQQRTPGSAGTPGGVEQLLSDQAATFQEQLAAMQRQQQIEELTRLRLLNVTPMQAVQGNGRCQALTVASLVALAFANILQHAVHPSLDVLERAAVAMRGAEWMTNFYVYDVTVWTPGHEVMSQRLIGKFVYLTVQVLAFQLLYAVACVAEQVSASGSGTKSPRARAVLCRLAPLVDGLGICVFTLFSFFALMHNVVPAWRSQWDAIESDAIVQHCQSSVCDWVCRHYGVFMWVLHFSGALGAFFDLASKDPDLVLACTPKWHGLFVPLTIYTLLFHVLLFVNFKLNKGAIPYPWYYDMKSKLDFALYLVFVDLVLLLVLHAVRRWSLRRATRLRACQLADGTKAD